MRAIPTTHAEINQNLQTGHFGVQMSDKNNIPQDQCVEETNNKSSKIPGGIFVKSTNQTAVSIWIENAADCSQTTQKFSKWLV